MIKNINNLITYQNLAYNLLTIENNNLNIYLKFKIMKNNKIYPKFDLIKFENDLNKYIIWKNINIGLDIHLNRDLKRPLADEILRIPQFNIINEI